MNHLNANRLKFLPTDSSKYDHVLGVKSVFNDLNGSQKIARKKSSKQIQEKS